MSSIMLMTRKQPQALCPECREQLRLSRDMWGPYWLCEECGFVAEDDGRVILCEPAAVVTNGPPLSGRSGLSIERPER